MASSDLPASTNNQNDGTTWRNSSPPPPESEHLLRSDITTATTVNILGFEQVLCGEKKQSTARVVAINGHDNLHHHDDARCTQCGHRPHRKPWTALTDFCLDPWRSFYKEEREVPKSVLKRPSFLGLFGHLWVHLIPALSTGALIGMNLWNPRKGTSTFRFEGWYIGAELWGHWSSEATLNFLQLAAKLHETVIAASLAIVAVDLVRYFLVYQPLGVPLGLLGAGSGFADMKYLVSKELHGIWKTKYSLWAKILVFLAVLFFCALANLVGPSSAILLIPRNHTWTVADFPFYLNGTREDHLWPTTLTLDHAGGPECHPDAAGPFMEAHCVSGGYGAIANYLESFISYPLDLTFAFDVQDSRTSRRFLGSIRHSTVDHYTETWTMGPHAATVMVTDPIRTIFNLALDHVHHNFRFASERSISVESTSPVVRSACQPVRGVDAMVFNSSADGGEEMYPMEFPILQKDSNWFPSPPLTENRRFSAGPTANVSLRASLLDTPPDLNASSSQPVFARTQWVQLPEDQFPFARAGLLILLSASDNGAPHDSPRLRYAFGCVADAWWAPAENTVASSVADWASAAYGYPTNTSPRSRRAPPTADHRGVRGDRLFLPDGDWTPITLTQAWLEALTPTIPRRAGSSPDSLPTTTLGALLEDWIPTPWAVAEHDSTKHQVEAYTDANRSELVMGIEHIVANLVADGVSRVGLSRQGMIWDLVRALGQVAFGDADKGVPANPDFSLGRRPLPAPFNGSSVFETGVNGHYDVDVGMGARNERLVMTARVGGYGIRMAGRGGKFALAVMSAYLAVVLAHVVFVVVALGGRTTDAFGSHAELLLLGMAAAGKGGGSGPGNGGKDWETEEMLSCGGVGVERAATYAKVVRIGTTVTKDRADDDGTTGLAIHEVRLSLEGGAADASGSDLGVVKPGVVYGLRHRG